MRISKYLKKILLLDLIVVLILLISGCAQDEYVYEVNDETIYPPNAIKDKLKSDEQYVAILYTNLFQKPMSIGKLQDVSDVINSVGDKEFVHIELVSNFMNRPDIIIPDDDEMRADIPGFVDQCYRRFYTRDASMLEKEWFTNYITTHPEVTAEMIYFSFGTSNEYLFY